MATEYIRISEALLDRLQGVAKHKLRELPLIQIPDTNVIIRRFKVQQVTSLHGKAQLVLLVIERENALPNRRFRLVLLQQSQLSLLSLYKRNTGAARNKGAIKPDWYSPPNR